MPELRASVIAPDADQLLLAATSVKDLIDQMVIDSPAMYENLSHELADISRGIKALEGEKDKLLKPVRELDASIRALFDPAIARRKEAKLAAERKLLTYRQEQERERIEAERRAQEAARLERERLEREAAQRRAEAEARAAEERRKAAEAAAAGDAGKAAALNLKAEQIEQRGEDRAAVLETVAQLTPAPTITAAGVPKVKGQYTRTTWKARVTDKAALIKFIASSDENLRQWAYLLDASMSNLNMLAKMQESNLRLPGVEAYEEDKLVQRTA